MESKTRRRTTLEFWVFHYIDNKSGRYKRNRKKDRLKMGREPERNSNKRIKIVSGKGKKRYRKKYKTLVRYRTGRRKRQNTFAVGEYIVSPLMFDTQEQAVSFLKLNFKLTNLDLSIIGAMCQKLNELNNQQPKNEEK